MSNIKEKFGQGVRFERIRRITGYLVGTMDKWCNSKKAEEKDRVKHGLSRSVGASACESNKVGDANEE